MLNRRKENALIALQELLTNTMTDRPEISNESKAIENALTNVEDVDNYVERFNDLEVLVHSFIADASDLSERYIAKSNTELLWLVLPMHRNDYWKG